MDKQLYVQITDYRNGAYPLSAINGVLTDHNSVILSKNIGIVVPVVEHGQNFFKTVTPECSHFFLINKKDCILLQQ